MESEGPSEREREKTYLYVPTECLAWCRRIRREERNSEKICHIKEKAMESERERDNIFKCS